MTDSLIQPNFDFLNDMPVKPQGLAEAFVVPPFSVLDARQGYWQNRKREWISLGLKGEEGRLDDGNMAIKSQNTLDSIQFKGKAATSIINTIFERDNDAGNDQSRTGTSIFDPVLCELMYRWFCPTNGSILDPFAGGSTRGVVAEYLGYKYTGIEIRPEQIEANKEQATKIGVAPTWILGDSANLKELVSGQTFDLIFTCPPYYDLEVYSSDTEGDLSSQQNYYQFKEWYNTIFEQAIARLQIDRFLVVVVGEIRDKHGIYRNFIGDNIAIFNKNHLKFYNDAILITAVGSLPIRTAAQFPGSRKLGKGHQNVLVFFKGNPDRIKDITYYEK